MSDTYYKTKDLFLGAALLTRGVPFVKTEVGDNPMKRILRKEKDRLLQELG